MALEIRSLHPDDLPALSRFLADGFAAPPDADFAATDVLRWKYLDPIGDDDAPRSFVACEAAQIVGHVGIARTSWTGPGLPPSGVSTLHMIDWLGSRAQHAVGASLMQHAHQQAETQYVLVANDRARRVTKGAGYAAVAEVTLFQKVLRVGYRWKSTGHNPAGRLARVVKDAARKVFNRGRSPQVCIALRRVATFGPEILPAVDRLKRQVVLTERSPERLNHALHYPRPGMSGWLVEAEGQIRGFALLSLIHHGAVRTGKVVECLLDEANANLEHAAVAALTRELAGQGAAVAFALSSTPAMAAALRGCGFVSVDRLDLTLRDRAQQIPQQTAFHVSALEADCAYQG